MPKYDIFVIYERLYECLLECILFHSLCIMNQASLLHSGIFFPPGTFFSNVAIFPFFPHFKSLLNTVSFQPSDRTARRSSSSSNSVKQRQPSTTSTASVEVNHHVGLLFALPWNEKRICTVLHLVLGQDILHMSPCCKKVLSSYAFKYHRG